MADLDVEVLQARLDGLQESFLILGALLNQSGVVSGQVLQAKIRSRIDDLQEPHPVLMEQMHHLADQLLRNFFHSKGLGRAEIDERLREVLADRSPTPD
ncbi:hypothetical protein IPC19_05075 [Pseudomonas aeruginosa]|nr:hypothetical protein AO969_22655 [Pseudomonas aeruginosa]OXZ14278.1 hypothetical protein ACG91_31715 [Pseudomonas aeruginosa]RQI54980.1 hypothetical protein IPC19_05075 [Pseudomonas aeruginosa]RRQ60951.1 hypothetical protein CR936_28205 [Pseudomonas aeruginosa]